MRESTVARVYAETLLELAREKDVVERVAGEVESLRTSFAGSPRLSQFLEAPEIQAGDKKALLRRGLGPRLSGETLRFLEVVVDRGRQELLPLVFDSFLDLVEELRNQETLAVTSAAPLGDELRGRLSETFARATGRRVVLEESLDPSLLGGVVVQVGDLRIDGSVRTRLENLRERMLAGARAGAAATT
ncbi:MAG: ATP synthase F1 subunit delta [Gemmatimonadota bacterium]